ncbi:MAG TPA: hypothetical protein VLL08_04210 [Kineosporiaceae bacterium]|nr:hypothetical protein [Kineosporiaceae bacterium]
MADGQCVTVCRADEAPGRCIDITEPIPTFGTDYRSKAGAFYRSEAERIHGALIASLPGGTLDQLFAVMAADRASLLRVPRPAGPAGPCADPIECGHEAALGEAEEQRRRALEIHKPSEFNDQECAGCIGSDENPLDWPCPTAQALGVTA